MSIAGLFPAHSLHAQQAAEGPVTTVEGVVVMGGGVPIPDVGDGAPVYTPLELRDLGREGRFSSSDYISDRATLTDCYMTAYGTPPNPQRLLGYDALVESSRRLSTTALEAERTTVIAQQIRINAADGTATMAQVVQTELDRQHAVLLMRDAQADLAEAKAMAIDIQQLVRDEIPLGSWNSQIYSGVAQRARGFSDPMAIIPAQFRDLEVKIENVRAVERLDDQGQTFVSVSGSIVNTRPRRISVPAISVMAIDQFGYTLVNESARARGRIEAGQSIAFAYDFKPSPIQTARIVVTFAGIEPPRSLYPASADPVCSPPAPAKLNPNLGVPNRSGPSIRSIRILRADQRANGDSDGDGIPDSLEDADADGIPDSEETQ